MKNNLITAFVLLLAMVSIVLVSSCASKKNPDELKPIPSEFYGEWQAQDGSRLQIFANGKGAFKIGGKSVEGGTVEYMPKMNSFEISLLGISETFRIDQAPSGNEMKLNGMVFRRVGGFALESPSTTSTPSRTSPASLPSDAELRELSYKSLRNFGNAVVNEDFTLFHALMAPEFQREFSPERLKTVFSQFIEKKVDVGMLIQDAPIAFSAPARLDENGVLKTQGAIASKVAPVDVLFSLDYVFRDGEWKLVGLDIKTQEPQRP
ncbi:MAG: hypothetical protein CMR00_03355 [[Chlorobium] sp. 445]|nr:MAG: hypothetical protein CMR00_03355 [[Chlorobium] sp. 445]